MSKEERPKRQGKIDTRLVDTGIYSTFEQHFVTDDGIDIPVGKIPIQSHKLVRKGEVLDYIAGEVQAAGDNGSEFKGEAQEAAKMLQKLKTALSESDVENAMYWTYFIGRAMERHSVRQHERNAKIGKDDQARRRKGGKATAKLTDVDKRRICELMNEQIRGRVTKTAASRRVAGQLAKEGLEVSGRTIQNVYKEAESENA